MGRLSSPIEEIKDHYTVVVVGSGYGAAIAASRLARAGQQVCVLERGREFQPGEYPNRSTEAVAELQAHSPECSQVGSRTALYELHLHRDINVFVGCGLGGTSLVNANIALRAEPRVFEDARWPRSIRDDLDGLEAAYGRAEEMLKPEPYPEHLAPLRKLEALRTAASSMHANFY